MKNIREISTDPVLIKDWMWIDFLNQAISSLSQLTLKPLPIQSEYLQKKRVEENQLNTKKIEINTWGCMTDQFLQVRAACLEAGPLASVLNFVIRPKPTFDLPFFGADFVRLPSGYLLALDLQPVLKSDSKHTKVVWDRLLPLYRNWQPYLPHGGDIPKEAEKYFSPGFLWTRLPFNDQSNQLILEVVRPAFQEYLDLYMDLAAKSFKVSGPRSQMLLEGQNDYLRYRARKDPARGMLKRFFGNNWTETYINQVLFPV